VLEALEDRRLLAVTTLFDEPARLVPVLDVNASAQAGAQSEIGVAVNPTNPLNMVAVANNNANLSQLVAYYSTNGGVTWTASFITSAQDGQGAPTRDSIPMSRLTATATCTSSKTSTPGRHRA
jgi:hypothetical protein